MTGTGKAAYLNLKTTDGLHPSIDAELDIEASNPGRALLYVR